MNGAWSTTETSAGGSLWMQTRRFKELLLEARAVLLIFRMMEHSWQHQHTRYTINQILR